MASNTASIALLLSLNLLFFALVSSNEVSCPPPPKNPSSCNHHCHKKASCPKDTLKLGVCADLLKGLMNLVIVGTPSNTPCCALIKDLADLEAAACLCSALKGNVLGIRLNVPVALSLLLNSCGKNVPKGFQCA